jgi:acyl-[acyl-carrier-protein]-phospholipid O-acyltransferase/long-chain-fatty-acid--[acyl-carrier-protein] ligase
VGGELVPHLLIEDELQKIVGSTERVFAVVGVPDQKKGERLVVLFIDSEGLDLKGVQKQLSQSGLPNLWIPDERNYHRVEEMPVLGSGKLDLQKLKKLALEQEGSMAGS